MEASSAFVGPNACGANPPPFKIAFDKRTEPKRGSAKCVGNADAGLAARRVEGAMDRRNSASPRRVQTFGPQNNVRPALKTSVPVMAPAMSEDEAAKEFSALVIEYTRGDLAQASERTKEAAKHWKAGTRAPNCSSLITMGRRNSRIRDWVIAQMDVDLPPSVDAPNSHQDDRAQLQMLASQPGQEGAMARAMLKILDKGE